MKYYSQAGQDKWVMEKVREGFFVDVGAYDGIESSNTYLLEQRGWKGVCIEANESVIEILKKNRKWVVSSAVAEFDGEIRFSGDKVNDNGNLVRCAKLSTILKEIDAPKIIDYLSIDVEGYEMNVLEGMDFQEYHVRYITIEHNIYLEGPARKNKIYEYLTLHGFVRVQEDVKCQDPNYFNLPYEDWYENSICI